MARSCSGRRRAGGATRQREHHCERLVRLRFAVAENRNGDRLRRFARREGQQYHWENAGYGAFEDFLGALSSGRRKTIRRERRDALAGVDEIVALTGPEITEDHWDAFANLVWNPVPFITTGIEYMYGRRVVVSNATGTEQVLIAKWRVAF